MDSYAQAYNSLNAGQKKAVDTTEGPVMVVAGPGTGKTQVLALRIAHILKKTDVGADGVLCLTFTRSGVTAMRERLERYVGADARKVTVDTFHSFSGDLIEQYYRLLDFDVLPTLLDDTQAVLLVDELLQNNDWEYIRPRTNPSQYFSDLRQLMSLLKRERITPAQFDEVVEKEIRSLKEDPESISSRGASKGQLKKEIEKRIESLERTKEVVSFYRFYETIKKERSLMDYDDVLEYAVALVEGSEEVRADIREQYQYILVDEHQDSSGVQNAFLKAVWEEVEQPNIFVVGDDRQLIYGFSGASVSYFESFSELFGKATLITLSDNYRSTTQILSLADTLLRSSVSKESLVSTKGEGGLVGLYEYMYERDELIGAVQYFKYQIAQGVPPEECALLVPKNRHVRSAATLFRAHGIPVALQGGASLFSEKETHTLLRVLRIITDPYDTVALAESMLDDASGIAPMHAHTFLHAQKGKSFSLETMRLWGSDDGLFAGQSDIAQWAQKLLRWIDEGTHSSVTESISTIGNEVLVAREQSHERLLRSVEIVRSLLHTAMIWEEKGKENTLSSYLTYIERLRSYNQDIPLASFDAARGVRIMTLHKSKGLEFDHVWVAHMNEEVLMAQKRSAFTLPETLLETIEQRDKAVATRELYVAITRAKKHCVLSYARMGYDARPRTLAESVAELPKTHFVTKSAEDTEKEVLSNGPATYIQQEIVSSRTVSYDEIACYVQEYYADTKVSVTLLNNFFSCPWKWYFRNFLKLPEVKGVSLALGSAVHSTIEYILKAETTPDDDVLVEKVTEELIREGVHDEKERKHLHKDAILAVRRWFAAYYTHLAKDRTSERSLSGKDTAFPHLQLYGKIDLTERFPDGTMVVTDFKTGTVKSAGVIEKETEEGRLSDYMRQLAMYSYLVRLVEKKDVSRSRLLFVEADAKEKNALYETHVGDEAIDLLIRDIKEYDAALKSGEWVNRECHHKGYGAQVECEYCALAKVFKK